MGGTFRAEKLSELIYVQGSDAEHIEANSEQLLLRGGAGSGLQVSKEVLPIEDVDDISLREVAEAFPYARGDLRLFQNVLSQGGEVSIVICTNYCLCTAVFVDFAQDDLGDVILKVLHVAPGLEVGAEFKALVDY